MEPDDMALRPSSLTEHRVRSRLPALARQPLGLVIFAGFTMFDFQRLRHSTDTTAAPLLAASVFLDVLNVFLFFLTIFSGGERDEPSTNSLTRPAARSNARMKVGRSACRTGRSAC